MKTLLNIGISAAVSIVAAFVFVSYAPMSWFDHSKPTFGSTVTTILGTDTLSASRTTINNNFSALNTSKAEISDVSGTTTLNSLAKVGTLTQGTWNASTITVPYGGTASTTLSQYQVLLGNGTGGVTVPSGWGTSGQVLTSAGPGVLPTWGSSAVNTTLDYTWTGAHTFNGATTTNFSITNYLKWNGLIYKINGSRQASSTALMEDGAGNLSWNIPPSNRYLFATTTSTVSAAGADSGSTSTVMTIPSGVLTASSTINVTVHNVCSNNGGTCQFDIRKSTGQTIASCINTANTNGPIIFSIFLNNTSSETAYCYTTNSASFNPTSSTVDLSGSVGFVIYHLALGIAQISTLSQAYMQIER